MSPIEGGLGDGQRCAGSSKGAEQAVALLVEETRAVVTRAVRASAEAEAKEGRRVAAIEQARAERTLWDRLAGENTGLRARLRETTHALVRIERANGVPPERVLILLKRIIQDAGASAVGATTIAHALETDFVSWCLEAYYAADDTGSDARTGDVPTSVVVLQ